MRNGTIFEFKNVMENDNEPETLLQSHYDGEVWGLDVVELGKGQTRIITSADDNRLLAYDVKSKFALAEG